MSPQRIASRDNPLIKKLRALAHDNSAYRKEGHVWLEGDHLCRALLARGLVPRVAVFTESAWPQADQALREASEQVAVIPDALMAGISALESPPGMGFLWTLPQAPEIHPGVPTVVLDRVQDTGNVGSVLRSAAAFGFTQVLSIKGSAALWSPKVLRAGMGAHFALHLVEGGSAQEVLNLRLPLLVTSSHLGDVLHRAELPWPCAWVFGHEGQGVSDSLMAVADRSVRIAQPGGEESLNVAAAAAICLHASAAARL